MIDERETKLLDVRGLSTHFPMKRGFLGGIRGWLRAVDKVSFTLCEGETLGLVGESGCGKSTLGKTLLRLVPATAGRVFYDGIDLFALPARRLRLLRRELQIIFQDPYSSLNPRLTVNRIVSEGIRVHKLARGKALAERTGELLLRVGIDPALGQRYPHEFSGGQRQRIGIARALSVGPRLIVCDEPVSALDVSIQAQVINLLSDLKKEFRLAYLFISHDLSVVRHISDRVAVMYLGRLVEEGPCDELFDCPGHPYTRALISAVPAIDPQSRRKRIVLEGEMPSPLNPPSGCPFHTRCPERMDPCAHEDPPVRNLGKRHWYRCFLDG